MEINAETVKDVLEDIHDRWLESLCDEAEENVATLPLLELLEYGVWDLEVVDRGMVKPSVFDWGNLNFRVCENLIYCWWEQQDKATEFGY